MMKRIKFINATTNILTIVRNKIRINYFKYNLLYTLNAFTPKISFLSLQ